jgi:uncharacterized protein (TIRG00374 family)
VAAVSDVRKNGGTPGGPHDPDPGPKPKPPRPGRRIAVQVLKLGVVAALMAYVFLFKVDFDDKVKELDANGKVVSEVSGHIDGPWNAPTVRFVPDVGEPRLVANSGPDYDPRVQLAPGLPTYWRYLDPWLFAGGAFCYFVTVLIAGTRWWWLLRVNGLSVSLPEALRLTWIGVFFNSVVPGQTGGDLIKAIYIMKRSPGQRIPALVSVIVDRVLGLGSLAVLGAIVVLFALDRYGWLAAAIWGVIGIVTLLGMFAFSKRLRQAIRLKALLDRLPHRVGHLLRLVDQAVFFYRGHKNVIAMSLLGGVVNHVFSILSVVLIGDALGIGLPWFDYFVLIPVINIISAVPLGPNGWGLGEWSYQGLFSQFGARYVAGATGASAAQIMGTRGVALSVLYRLHLTLWSLLGGLFVLFEKDRVTRADIEHEVELEDREDQPGTA